jgi:adenylate cyclase
MEPEGVKRKLTTILAADVEGYSRLMSADEEYTLKTLKSYREIIDGLIGKHDGRIFGTSGDSVIAEFGSAVEAVRCAITIQEELRIRNAELVGERQMKFRIGINVGDVMVEDDNLFGDGVNVAARLEGEAEAGGICISGSTFDQVKNKLSIGFEDIGPQEVKNIAEPIPAFRVVPGPVSIAATRRWRIPAIAAALVVIIAAGGLAWWQPWVERVEAASLERMAFPLPEKPSVAVLPFDNLSGDPAQEYFSDGMTENIITALSKIPDMFVIARNSSFTYKGKPVKVQQVAEELGVRYVLEGSVQRSGDQVRVTAQLIDAVSGHHLWAERYDRQVADYFAVQDDIARNVVTALEVKLTAGEIARFRRRQTDNLEAYEYFLRGNALVDRGDNKADNAEARRLYEKAVALDPNFSSAWIWLSITHQLDARIGWSGDRARSISLAADAVQKALAIDGTGPSTYLQLASIAIVKRQYDQAILHCEKALSLDPPAGVLAHCGRIWTFVDRPQEGLELITEAMRRNPYFPGIYFYVLGNAHRLLGNYDEAVAGFEAYRDASPKSLHPWILLANIHAGAGRMQEARSAGKEILERSPKFSIKRMARSLRYKDPAEAERILANLRKAGLPEE